MRPSVREAYKVANEYLHGKEDLSGAVHRLKERGALGYLLTAEILIEQASKDYPKVVPRRLLIAQQDLKIASSLSKAHDKVPIDGAKAAIRRAQLPTLMSIFWGGRLPNPGVTKTMYSKLVHKAVLVADMLKDAKPDTGAYTALKGIVGEQAVVLLDQRRSLRDGVVGRLSLQSFFSEDHGGDCLRTKIKKTWDVNTYTQLKPEDPVEATGKLQIKSAKNRNPVKTDVSTLYVFPDLAIKNDYDSWPRRVGDAVIRGCYAELLYPSETEQITRELDERTEKLIAIYG